MPPRGRCHTHRMHLAGLNRTRRSMAGSFGAILGVLALGAGATGCSSGSTPTAATRAVSPAPCTRGAPAHGVTAVQVAGSTSDWTVTSFDGTLLRVHWFPVPENSVSSGSPAGPHPTVLMGPGWSLPGDTDTRGTGILGGLPIHDLWAAGYNVMTWDPRGFGKSNGAAGGGLVDERITDRARKARCRFSPGGSSPLEEEVNVFDEHRRAGESR